MTAKATCPVCASTVTVFWHGTRRLFSFHGPAPIDADSCEASGWLVEDDELHRTPRKPRSDRGIAQPSRSDR